MQNCNADPRPSGVRASAQCRRYLHLKHLLANWHTSLSRGNPQLRISGDKTTTSRRKPPHRRDFNQFPVITESHPSHPASFAIEPLDRRAFPIRKGAPVMVKYALFGMLKAKPGKEAEVEAFLKQGAELAKNEKGTVTWYAINEGNGRYGIFDTFEDEAGREAHLNGEIAKALMAKAGELLSEPPQIHKIGIIATK
jgi:quinol monooxygenase YgiN